MPRALPERHPWNPVGDAWQEVSVSRQRLNVLWMVACVLGFAWPSLVHADLESCGGIFLGGGAACSFQPTEECMKSCEPVAVETSCAAELYTQCESDCTASASAECQTECESGCTQDCMAPTESEGPGCLDLCLDQCQARSDGTCAGGDRPHCHASCGQTCGDICGAKCAGVDEPEAEAPDCSLSCKSACAGSCQAEANLECQVQCQTKVFSECETTLVEKCQTECMTTGGAIFCDGQFLNYSDVDACAAELAAEFDVHVDLDIDASAGFEIDLSDDDGDGKRVGCSVVGGPGAGGRFAGLGAPILLSLVIIGRRRRAALRR